jgi:cytochrome c553
MHEEIGVAISHGYARAAGKPMSALIYAVLGLQHASMAVYNAWADRVPIVMFAGNVVNQNNRFGPPGWYHSAVDLAPLLGGALKWSDQPASMQYMPDGPPYAARSFECRQKRRAGACRCCYTAEMIAMKLLPCIMLYLILCGLSAAHAADDNAGQLLFKRYNCYQCHGDVGQGGAGPTIAPPHLPALPAFIAFLRHPAEEMPAFTAKVISDADIATIHAYLAAQPIPGPDLPELLRQPQGSR